MAGDFIREVRGEVIPALAADPTLAYVEGVKVYTSVVNKPEWPFLRWGEPTSTPLRLSCGSGARVGFNIHVFARHREVDGKVPQTAEDYCADITAQVKHVLHKRGWQALWGRVTFRVRSVRLIPDAADNRSFHGIVAVEARALAGSQ